ncbi:RrF2 family transcriptional regulator [Saccharicrinis fermentans]|uniref:Iron-responsive transcriptional regulator n=1 Tax=Saccharicrinis fermentans DSM 9555 = JCM 21142 TaxID=869213 RepID=W7Y2L7_9BACT|nr:Rrf2 family transcriptional regulator [Saccharicrinis fermentans]GAF01803.1 iron-responsive transcriptional regulator [Saccharicrinis fermentans DSM 9555 = JCM 21142]
MLSNTCKYAVRSVIYLALNQQEDKKIGIKQISKDLDIPTPFLGKILQTLAKQKMLLSNKGPHGGFSLAIAADEITLLDIVSIIDGLDVFENCMIGMNSCQSAHENNRPCPVHDQFCEVRSQMFKLFKEETIGNITRRIKNKEDYYLL